MNYLLRHGEVVDEQIKEAFPINSIGKGDELIPIGGSGKLIDIFKEMNIRKMDISENLRNIEFIELSSDNEVELYFKENSLKVITIYDARYSFFEELFSMAKFEKFCFNKKFIGLVTEVVEELFRLLPGKANKYRLIEKDKEWKVRAITSTNYKNYDNSLAVYIVLIALSKLYIDKNINFSLNRGYITDSELKLFFEQENFYSIEGLGNISFGLMLSNSEIKESVFSLEAYYKITDPKNNNISCVIIRDLKDSIFSINHTLGVCSAIERVKNIYNLVEVQLSMLNYIKDLGRIGTVSDNIIYRLMLKVTDSRLLLKETKNKFKDIYDKEIINNTMTILQLFNKVEHISNNIEEVTTIQRIYNEIIKELLHTKI